MEKLSQSGLVFLLIALALMLITACFMTEVAKKIKCPSVVGELLAGIALGPTIFGAFFPETYHDLYNNINFSKILDGIFDISAIMLLFVAGLEIQLNSIYKHVKIIIYTSFFGFIVPFLSGFLVVWYFPNIFFQTKSLVAALFLGTALSVSALPVIARILIELELIKSKMGTIIISTAMLTDIVGWGIFSFIIKIDSTQNTDIQGNFMFLYDFFLLLVICIVAKYCLAKSLPWFFSKKTRHKYLLPLALSLCFLLASYTEFINFNASLGAFIAGILFNNILEAHSKTKEYIEQFVIGFFAPLFFVSIGLHVNFIKNFDLKMTAVIILLACITKIAGAAFGAYLSGLLPKESIAIGFGLTARGAIGIILSTIALQIGIINQPLFVALVIMAIVTSIVGGAYLKLLQFYDDKHHRFLQEKTS